MRFDLPAPFGPMMAVNESNGPLQVDARGCSRIGGGGMAGRGGCECERSVLVRITQTVS